MKKLYLILLASIIINQLIAQTIDVNSQWTWINGDNLPYQYAIYGTKGITSPSNHPGGREDGCSWKDKNGNLWIFGGYGFNENTSGYLNDLWKYDPNTNLWTWVSGTNNVSDPGESGTKGIPSINNIPSAREYSSYWVDLDGNLWLLGGWGVPEINHFGYLNDLWKYNVLTNEWTFVSGSNAINQAGIYGTKGVPSSNNNPGGRQAATSNWVDSDGNFWLFGGFGVPGIAGFGYLNDLWKYNVSTNQWTWVSGSNLADQNGVYGTQGVPSVNNIPTSRQETGSNFIDINGNFWLFGGENNDLYFNDLWRYNLSTNEWTWMKGSNISNQPGVYGTKGVPSDNNTPGARVTLASWTEKNSREFILYGGRNDGNFFEDLWKYNIESNNWTWIKGDSLINKPAVYGTKGIPSINNTPGNRSTTYNWVDNSGNLWLFGGNALNGINSDLWKLNASYTCNATGTLQREVWSNIPGSTVASIPLNTPPDSVGYITSFEGPTNVANLYGARYRGYICVPVTGDYTFWIASDDDSELWLSTDNNPVNKVRIAYVNGWTYPRTYNKYPSQQSAPIHLLAGHSYYIEALHKEAYGNDNLSVGWQLPGGTLERPIPGTRLSPYIEVPPTVTITQPTNGETFNAPADITIDATVTNAGEGAYFKISNPSGGYRKFKLGYDNISIYHSTHNVTITGNNKLEITLRDFTGTADWTKLQIRPNGSTANPLSLAPYVNQIGGVGNEFVSISIPLSDFDPSIDFTQLKMFEVPYSINAAPFTIGIQKIIFTGGSTPFLWFGDDKTDNAHDGDGSGGQFVVSLIPPSGLGGVSKVEFYNGSTKIGEDYTPRFSFVWKNVPAGTYTLTALARLNSGTTATSAPVTISVGPGMAVIFPGAKTGLINSTTSEISVYPNPVQNRVVISQVNDDMKVLVLDEMGNVVFQNNYSEMAGGEADLSKLPSGIYLLKLEGVNTNFSKTVKLIKQ